MPPTERISPHLTAPHPHLTASRCSPSRGFCNFAIFTSFCKFSSQVEIRVKRAGIWLTGGAPVAIRRRTGPQFSLSFCVFSPKTENGKNTGKTQLFKIPAGILLRGCLLGAPGCSFSGSLKFEKHTFPKKGLDPKKHGISLYPMVLAQKSVPLIFGPPGISKNYLKKVTTSDSKTNSEKSVTSFSSWVRKGRKYGTSDAPGGSLSGPPAPPHTHLTCISCPLLHRILHFCSFRKFLHVFSASRNSR